MKAEQKLARQRLSVLELAEALGTFPKPAGDVGSRAPSSTSTSAASRRTVSKGFGICLLYISRTR